MSASKIIGVLVEDKDYFCRVVRRTLPSDAARGELERRVRNPEHEWYSLKVRVVFILKKIQKSNTGNINDEVIR